MQRTIVNPVRSVREQITNQLRNEILADKFPENEPLREVALAERFGTSRGPIRDALLQLSQEGALVYKPNSGVRVSAPVQNGERVLLMALRKQIELHALPELIRNLTGADHRALEEILDAMKLACRRKDLPDIVGSDIALHRYIVRRGGSPELEAVWQSIAVRIRMAYSRLNNTLDIYREHEKIVAAIKARNELQAIESLEANLI